MSGLFGSTTIKGTRITDFTGTSAEVGRAIAFGYGTFPVDGFIGWAPLPPVEHRKVKRQGKGGVKQETYTYTLSYAVFFCKGPVSGFKWIKRNGKVVYTTDPNAPIEDRQYAAKWAQRVNFHWGTRDQLPDSLIESYEGVGNVSGFPYSCYITIEDEDVTDNGGAPPNYEACVIVGAAKSYTTPPYPVYLAEGVGVDSVARDPSAYLTPLDMVDLGSVALNGTLRPLIVTYTTPTESIDVASVAINGVKRPLLVSYTAEPEPIDVSSVPLDGTKRVILIQYFNYDPEAVELGSVSLDGTHAPI